jgi:hypothetical protein
MTLRGIARNVVRALCICTLAVLTAGCPLRIQGEITTKPAGVGPGGSGPGTIMAGTWCCKTATTKKGTGCTAVPKGTTATSCPSAGGGPSVLLDCTGNSVDNAGTVTCD